MQETQVQSLGEDPLKEGMATHSGNPMDKGARRAAVHWATRGGHDLPIEQQSILTS